MWVIVTRIGKGVRIMPDLQIILGITERGDDWDISLGTDPDDALTAEEMWETLCDIVDSYRAGGNQIVIHLKDAGIAEQAHIQLPGHIDEDEAVKILAEIVHEYIKGED